MIHRPFVVPAHSLTVAEDDTPRDGGEPRHPRRVILRN